MSNAQTAPAAPPVVTVAEKAAMLVGTVAVAALLVFPPTRGAIVDAFTSVFHFGVDAFVNGARAVGSFLGDILGITS